MNKEYLFKEIEKFMTKVNYDYQNNIIAKDKCELIYNELFDLFKNYNDRDFLLTSTKFDTIKTIYIIMK